MRTLPSWQVPFLGLRRFPRNLTRFEIDTFFSFSVDERRAIKSRRGDQLRLAFGVNLGFLKMAGTTLSAVDRIPLWVLARVATHLDLPTNNIATIRSLYQRRKRTLYEHQQWAMQLLGIEAFSDHRQRSLMRAFRPPNPHVSDARPLAVDIMSWLYTRCIRIPGPRRVQAMALKVVRRAEHDMASSVISAVPDWVQKHWEEELLSTRGALPSHLEWLGKPPSGRSTRALDDAIAKLAYLRTLCVPTIRLPGINLKSLVELAQRCRARRPSRLRSLRAPIRTLELACFLRYTLLTTTDTIHSLCDMRTADLRRQARQLANKSESMALQDIRALVSLTRQYAEDAHRSDADVRRFVLDTLPSVPTGTPSSAHRYREALSADEHRVCRLLNCMTAPRLECAAGPEYATVALANKTARMACAVVHGETEYNPELLAVT